MDKAKALAEDEETGVLNMLRKKQNENLGEIYQLFKSVEPRTDQFKSTPVDYICIQFKKYIRNEHGARIIKTLKNDLALEKSEKEDSEKRLKQK